MAADQHVVDTRNAALPFEMGTDLTIVGCGRRRKRRNLDPGGELLNGDPVLTLPREFFCPEQQFSKRYCRDAKFVGLLLEPFADTGRPVLDPINANIRVQHILQHQSGSRSRGGGSIRSFIKSSETCGPFSKKYSHRLPTGVMILVLPRLIIST